MNENALTGGANGIGNAIFVTGQKFIVDGGMSKQMIYHEEHGWRYEED